MGCRPWGHEELDTTEQLHFHAVEKDMATHSSVLAWRIPGTGEPGGLPSMGSHRVGHAAAAKCKVKLLSRVRLFVTPWSAAHQAPPSMGFSRQEFWSGVPLPSLFLPLGQGKLKGRTDTLSIIMYNSVVVGKN